MKKKIRIALAICPSGEWNTCGASSIPDIEAHGYAVDSLPDGEKRYWVELEVEIPNDTAEVIEGKVIPL